MSIQKITIEQLPALAMQLPVLDVRSPVEYDHAHIPGAYSLPLFSHDERKIIGTAYKKESREKAIKIGLDFFGIKMRGMVEAAEQIINDQGLIDKSNKTHNTQPAIPNPQPITYNSLIVHCWRGGMRSSAVAWLLNFYGFEVFLLEGGYKAYRNRVLQQLEKEYDCHIIGGYTGSGKTALLKQLKSWGQHIVDLEGLASHKGSAFGALGQPKQPTQEMFENLLVDELDRNKGNFFWIEDESQRIGALNIPKSFWQIMRSKPVWFVDIPFEERLDYIISEYGILEKQSLADAIGRIQKRLGPMETKTAIKFLAEGKIKDCFRILLTYYDKSYTKSLHNREDLPALLNKISCSSVDTISNTEKLISCTKVNS